MNAVSNEKRPTSMAFYIRPTGTQTCRGFKVHDLITCKSKVQVVVSLGRALSFVRPRAQLSIDQWHVTRSPPIRKRIWVGRYNKYILTSSQNFATLEITICIEKPKCSHLGDLLTHYHERIHKAAILDKHKFAFVLVRNHCFITMFLLWNSST